MTWHTRNWAIVAAPSGFWAILQAEQRLTWCPSPPRWWWSGPPAPGESSSASAAGCGTGRSSPACAPRSRLQQAAKKYNATGSETMQCKGQYDGRTLPFKWRCTEKSALNGKNWPSKWYWKQKATFKVAVKLKLLWKAKLTFKVALKAESYRKLTTKVALKADSYL